MLSKEEECVRIVEELRRSDKLIGDDMVSYGIACDQVMIDRIIAAVKPKGPWPVYLSEISGMYPTRSDAEWAEIGSDCGSDGLVLNLGAHYNGFIFGEYIDRLVVAWLKHRGVDLEYIMEEIGEAYAMGSDGPPHYTTRKALRAILDNAEA